MAVEGTEEPVLGCSSRVHSGIRITTDTPECKTRVSVAMNRIVNKIRFISFVDVALPNTISARTVEDYSEVPELGNVMQHIRMYDQSTAISVDMTKCMECTRCVRMCRDVQGLGIWKFNDGAAVPITTSTNQKISETTCISCGQVCGLLV